jgi:hypothetical protein
MMATYLGVVGFLVLYIVVNIALSGEPELEQAMALADPFGIDAFQQATRYWTPAERNTLLPSFSGDLLLNRLIWIAFSLVSLALAFVAFRFADKGMSKSKRKKQQLAERASAGAPVISTPLRSLPAARSSGAAGAQLWARTRFETNQVFRSPAFFVLMVLGLFNAISGLWFGGDLFGTPVLPVTRSLIPILEGSFTFIPLIIAIYYSGEVVWGERDRKMHEIVDATPLPNWAYAVPKIAAVSLVLLSTLLISVVAAILVQLVKGYTNLELGKYFLWYILPTGVDLILLAVQ